MIHYIIDGNNLIGKVPRLKILHLKDKRLSRSELVSILNSYFAGKKINLTLHLDGFKNLPLNLSKGKIVYSDHITADTKIRDEIIKSKNPKLITLVSSDQNLLEFAKANSCTVLKSEAFIRLIEKSSEKDEEIEALKKLKNDRKFFNDLFGCN